MHSSDQQGFIYGRANTRKQILDLVSGYVIAQSLFATARINLAEHLQAGARSLEQLAQLTATHPVVLARLLSILVDLGLVKEVETHLFQLEAAGEYLAESNPHSIRHILMMTGDLFYPALGEFTHTLRTGNSGAERYLNITSAEFYSYLKQHPELADTFDKAMEELTELVNTEVVQTYDFSQVGSLVDVGGNMGQLVRAIATQYPGIRCTLFDMPSVIEKAQAFFVSEELKQGCELIGGDFFQSIPVGRDLYILKNVLIDWNTENSIKLLQQCRQAMGSQGRLLIIQRLRAETQSASLRNKLANLTFMTMRSVEGGGVRSLEEYAPLAQAAGLKITHVIPLESESEVSIIELQAE